MSRESEAPPGPDPLIGRVLADKLEVEALLGEGAMGRVYRARHLALDKTVAIKVLHRELNTDKSIVGRFKAEARGASRLTHPNAVQILDFGVDGPDGLLYIAMEFLEGEDMAKVLTREQVFTPVRAANLMVQILGALADAHDQGVIHRDMKPGNIVITPRRGDDGGLIEVVKVCDFGLAKLLDGGADQSTTGQLTKAGQVFGTPAFMSPEQARGEVLDARTDLYSCGCILYRMLSGDTPFRAESVLGVLMKQISEEPTPLEQLAPSAPPRLIEIVRKAMKKDREQRYASAREMRQELVALFGTDISQPYIPVIRGASGVAALSSPDLVLEATAPSLSRVPDEAASGSQVSLSATPGPTRSVAWWVMLPGIIALVLLGGLALFVVQKLDRGADATPPPTAPVAEARPIQPPPVEPPPVAPVAPVEPAPEPAKPVEAPPLKPTPRSGKEAKRPVRPTKAVESPPKPVEPPPPPEPVVEKPPAPPPLRPSGATDVQERAAALERELQERAKAEASRPKPPPLAPAKPPPASKLMVEMSDLKVSGGMSKGRIHQALSRYFPEGRLCLAERAGSFAVGDKGAIRIKASIELSGRLKGIEATGGPAKINACVVDAFRSAVLPKPDTGGAKLEFSLEYHAS